MEVDIRFFQVAATIIPTLFIAFAISSKIFDSEKKKDGDEPKSEPPTHITLRILLVASAPFAFICAEALALATLITNSPSLWAAYGTAGALISALWLVGVAAMRQYLVDVEFRFLWLFISIPTFLLLVVFAVFSIMLITI